MKNKFKLKDKQEEFAIKHITDFYIYKEDSHYFELINIILDNFEKNQIDYNKTFKRSDEDYKSYSVQLRPDYSLEVHTNDKTYYIHFDAKYKMHVNSESFKNEDIVKMHAYKDAIPNTIGSYILYPGSNNEIYYENEFESVGAFGLIPGEERIDKIAEFISKLLDNIENIKTSI